MAVAVRDEQSSPVVSIILVNFRGAEQTLEAVRELERIEWPREALEVIVVDNASGDGSAERLRSAAPHVRVVESASNLGFAGGCNLGVRASTGAVVGFLNSDARPDPQWVAEAMRAFDADRAVGAVASRVLDWEGRLVDFIDAGLTWFGKGYKPFVGEPVGTLGQHPKDVLFGTGAAMFVRRDVFDELGGFDDDYFMFYEDVDLGWRINLAGYRFRYQPTSVAYHRHHGTVAKFGSFKEGYLLERNALFTLYKNLEQGRLDEVLPAALALTVRRGVAAGGLDSESLDFVHGAADDVQEERVSRATLASVYAVDQFVEHLPRLAIKREAVQRTRKLADADVWGLFGRVDVVVGDQSYVEGHEAIAEAFSVTEPPQATRVLIITGDPIGMRMAGPAIRAWNMAEALSVGNDVVLVTTSTLEQREAPFRQMRVRPGDGRAFAPLCDWADVIVFQGHAMQAFPAIADSDAIVVADVYDPMHLEQLEQARELPLATWEKSVADATEVLNEQLARGDFFLCASERQRMLYLGQLAALGRVNPANYADDGQLRGLIDVVPFGLENGEPVHERRVLKGVHPGIGPEDKLILWGGGLYNWFDPETLIRAVASLRERRPNVRLFFQGTKHPHPGVPEMEIVSRSRALAAELDVLDSHVFFNDAWVAYADRQNYLLEADLGVSTHHVHLETAFAFRTRILDYLWAGLPMVVTEGDQFAELVQTEGLGRVVSDKDVDGLADALEQMLFDDGAIAAAKAAVARVRERFRWREVLGPLVAFVADPHRAADAQRARVRSGGAIGHKGGKRRKHYGLAHNLGLVAHYWRNGGLRVVVGKVVRRLKARLAGA